LSDKSIGRILALPEAIALRFWDLVMHLSSFGLITLDGSVTKLEPSQDFDSYQASISRYGTTLALKSRIESRQRRTDEAAAPKAAPDRR